ncbi:MAG: M28 family peptidase [Candidatus Eisenbacteria bacterium]|uniref:M28 family peptidase n=1 Tax=Eiseniibacteriota bacterium TaxID=2212470 RepID=A0A9D6L7N5_UNCEI|nr:M28 family peptidase [Candidatus Eisenbacteria bacterium]MBI3540251.1 M28 family peptidase [Candidatus Eisenbacteria bacterium]
MSGLRRAAALGTLALLLAAAAAADVQTLPNLPRAPRPAFFRPSGRYVGGAALERESPLPPGHPRALTDSATVMWIVRRLASPGFEGRGPGTAGLDSAADFIAREMRWLGLAPAGDGGTFFQRFDVTTGVAVATPCAVEVGGRAFPVGDAFQPLGFSTNGRLRAPVVFAGYGITAPGYDYDDYAGIDVHDRVVLVMSNEPGEMDSTSRFDGNVNTPHADLWTKAINAREHGALGLLVVDGPRYHAGEPLRAPRAEGAGYMTSGIVGGFVSTAVAAALLRGAPADLAGLQTAIDKSEHPHSLALAESVTVSVTLKRTRAANRNVVGMIPGLDTTRTLVIGAHYDHLGYGDEHSLAPNSRLPHLGADDNASGVAAMLSVAAWKLPLGVRTMTPRHTLIFCAFAGEEEGLLGSSHFTDDPPRPIESVEAMLNMDMVGRMRDNKLMVMGVGTAKEFPALVDDVNKASGFTIATSSDGYGPSDQQSFYKKHVPVLMLFTGAHADYHKPSDSPDKINAAGLWKVALFAKDIVDSLDAWPKPTFQQAKADSAMGRIAGGGGYGAYLGTIPDYMKTEGGVLLSGVRGGSPADSAGLKGGDVVVRFDGIRVDNIYDYTFALRSRKPGQQVRITVQRDGRDVELVAVLGRRK